METFCSIIALELILGFVIIPLYLFVRIYYYFIPSFINAYVTDRFEVINELNKTRFLVLSILLFCSFFFGISSTKIILSFDNSQFSFLTAFKIEFLTIVLLIVQFFIYFSIEKKIPNSLISIIKENLSNINNFTCVKRIYLFRIDSIFKRKKITEESSNTFLLKNRILLEKFNVKLINHSLSEIENICKKYNVLFADFTQLELFVYLINNQFTNADGSLIDLKIYLQAINSREQNDKKTVSEFLRKLIVFEKSDKYKFNNKHIEFLNKYFILNNIENPFNSKDSKYYF
ncbi:hypothetical protein [Chishuiella sp.]|uniref:hypothetical protein n=1 Tax=Chishuiella sp. TaxID=1969467 RepID=UPI0028AE3BD4|nr:hypothetical protein [Chishuiella sp.]